MGTTRCSVTALTAPCPFHRVFNKVAFGICAVAGMTLLMLLSGCAEEAESETSVMLEEPRVANGLLLDEDDPNQLHKLVEALDAMDFATPKASPAAPPADQPKTAAPKKPAAKPATPPKQSAKKPATPPANSAGGAPAKKPAGKQAARKPAQINAAQAAKMVAKPAVPTKPTLLVTLPKLSTTEMSEISESLALHLESQLGYTATADIIADALPAPPKGIVGGRILSKSDTDGTRVLRFGYRVFISQPLQLWVFGVVIAADGKLSTNPALATIEPQVTKIIASLNAMRANLTVRDLEKKLIQLSYADATIAIDMLKGLGITTMPKASAIPPKIDFAKLPFVVEVGEPEPKMTGLVGEEKAAAAGRSKLSMVPGAASTLSENVVASPMTQLLVMFHPAHPEQFSEVRHILDTYIDRPARQIFIEAMVLEISETGLKELGVEWDLAQSPLTIGAGDEWPPGESVDGSKTTLDIKVSDMSILDNVFDGEYGWNKWTAQLRALIRSGKAEILSRPSVLTLNNRQSTIRVGQDIPIASSLQGSSYSSKVSFAFEYLPTGILLNIRPRINEDGKEVSMLIDTIVSAQVPNEDLEMRSADGTLLASAPTVSSRRVQTYSRIPNNTPLIIGGLVARDLTTTEEKIPLLGDIPLFGGLFRTQREDRLKREVIIVLTPHVLPEDREARRSYPKDEDHFDSFGNSLFRDSYRIRSDDVFDLTFLLENQRIVSYRSMARQVGEKDFRLAGTEPFRSFVRDEVPGEYILVTRMIYEVVKRLEIAEKIESSKVIYFQSEKIGGYNVAWLEKTITDPATRQLKDFGDKALAITYEYDRDSLEAGRLGTEPIPDIRLVDCPDDEDRAAWKEKLWELNQPENDGRKRHTILIQLEEDVVRLRRALALKKIAVLNGDIDEMRLANFSVGKTLLMPELKKGQVHVIDADTARFFFHTELYYAAALAEIEEKLTDLDKMLRRPEINILLDSGPLADNPAGNGE